jgi:hypothetical protein
MQSRESFLRQAAEVRERARDMASGPSNDPELTEIQQRHDEVFRQLTGGAGAPRPLVRERSGTYRARLGSQLQPLSDRWNRVNLFAVDLSTRKIAEKEILADARKAIADRHQGDFFDRGKLRRVDGVDPSTGVPFTEWRGNSTAQFMAACMGHIPFRVVTAFTDRNGHELPSVRYNVTWRR